VSTLHEFFTQEDFYYTNPPILTRSDAEGAGQSFNVTCQEKDFFGLPDKGPRLTVSSQLHLEALMMGLGRVWCFGPTFRAERSMTSRHLAEFWMLEVEWGVDTLEEVMAFVERMITRVVGKVQERGMLEEIVTTIDGQDNVVPTEEIPSRWTKMTSLGWKRMIYADAVEMLLEEDSLRPFDIAPRRGRPLQSSHEQFLASQYSTPVFVTDYPAHIKPFYMLRNSDAKTVANFDLLVPGMAEIAGGSLRTHDLTQLEQSMREKHMNESELEWYKDLRRWGSIPHGGFGLGFDRLLTYLSGLTNLREVVPFPRMYGKSGCLN
jgi:asparaginyl-tRNA synthetase